MPRPGTPPPPPPAHVQAWPNHEAMLADRARALDALTKQLLGPSRLLLLWGLATGVALALAFIAAAVGQFTATADPFSALTGAVMLALGTVILIPTGLVIGLHVRRDLRARELLWHWLALGHDPVRDTGWQAKGLRRLWLLASLALAVGGLALCGMAFASLTFETEAYSTWVWLLGLCAVMWLTATLGLMKVHHHRRWSTHALRPPVQHH